MTEKTKEKVKPKVKATHVAKASPAIKYTTPNVYSVSAKITADDPDFLPSIRAESQYSDVKVVVDTVVGNTTYKLNHRCSVVVDCGFKIKLPAGFQIKAEANRTWAQRGLFVAHAYLEDDSLKLVLINIGQETPLAISHKMVVAQIWAEPAYFFDFNACAEA